MVLAELVLMLQKRVLIFTLLLFWLFINGCKKEDVNKEIPAKKVTQAKVVPLNDNLLLPLNGHIQIYNKSSSMVSHISERIKDYLISVPIPKGIYPRLSVGKKVSVILPLVHNQEATAVVNSIDSDILTLRLSKQIQELNGQKIKVIIPFSSKGLFKLPFRALYSPLGNKEQIFIIRNEHVQIKSVKVITVLSSTEVIVAGDLADSDWVAIQGIDNLIAGDLVIVVDENGVKI